jgi:hypothetical protein
MRKISNLCRLSLFALFLVTSSSAQGVQNPVAIIDRFIESIGGKKELSGIRSIRAYADCAGPRGRYTTEIHSAAGSRLIFRQVREGGGGFVGQTLGPLFWTRDERGGDFSLAERRAAFSWRSHEFQWLMTSLGERYSAPSFDGREMFAGRAAIRLRVTDELGHPAHLYFDDRSGLMLGLTIRNPFSPEPESIRTVFNQWRQVGKVKLPSKVTVTDKQGDFVLDFKDISINAVRESVFTVPPQVEAMNELLGLHQQARADHFNRDAKSLVSTFADDFTDVSNGRIRQPARGESVSRMQRYFDNSTFLEWDDLAPPVIKVSSDATMGYVIVHKRVRLLAKTETGKSEEETEVFAWVAIYRKIDGRWKLTTVASTRTPEDDAAAAVGQPSSQR